MIRIIADDKIPFLKGILDSYVDIRYLPTTLITRNTVENVDALFVRTRTRCDEKLLKGTSVKFIATAAIGFDHFDTAFCEANNIRWVNTPGSNASAVLQYIASALFSIAEKEQFQLKDKTLGIIGVGNIGSRVEKLGRLLGIKVLLNDPPRERIEGSSGFVQLEKLLQESDLVTLHVPLNRSGEYKTYHLIDEEVVSKIKKGFWVINTSRGEVTETAALKKGLSTGKLSGMVLDVWEGEPLVDPELLNAAFLATPHIAGYSVEGKANGTAMIVRALADHFHLPLLNWYPQGIPEPQIPDILIDAKNKNQQEIIKEAILHTYPIRTDDNRFRTDPATFEYQRENYPFRREFPAYRIHLQNDAHGSLVKLTELGFQEVITPHPPTPSP